MEPHRAELHAHCYRMLGSVQDAEDALQEALLGAWRGLPASRAAARCARWLYKVATNACLKLVERRPKRVLPDRLRPGRRPARRARRAAARACGSSPTRRALDRRRRGPSRYEQRESVELAFIAALQHLPARQRAVLILSEVLGFSGAEVADALETTPASVYSALQRAHKTVDERLPDQSQQATLRALGDERLRELVGEYVAAWERGDVDAVAALLTDDATLAMPPRPEWFAGPRRRRRVPARHAAARGGSLARRPGHRERPAGARGVRARRRARRLHGARHNVLTLEGGRVAGIMAFLDPALFARFGLPDRV